MLFLSSVQKEKKGSRVRGTPISQNIIRTTVRKRKKSKKERKINE